MFTQLAAATVYLVMIKKARILGSRRSILRYRVASPTGRKRKRRASICRLRSTQSFRNWKSSIMKCASYGLMPSSASLACRKRVRRNFIMPLSSSRTRRKLRLTQKLKSASTGTTLLKCRNWFFRLHVLTTSNIFVRCLSFTSQTLSTLKITKAAHHCLSLLRTNRLKPSVSC